MKKFTVNIGDKVAYSAQFCRSIGAQTGDIPRMRGIVREIRTFAGGQLAVIRWNDGTEGSVLSANLSKVGANSRFCQC